MAVVDVVVVSYNSRDHLRRGVEALARTPEVDVFVVDNASSDHSLDAVADLDVHAIALPSNRGFGAGCNAGWLAGSSQFVLFLNPDAAITSDAVDTLVRALVEDPSTGAVAPRIHNGDGSIDLSQRHFPATRSTFAQALFAHRLRPNAEWTDEVIRDPAAYERRASPDWLSGACLLVRRSALERIDGFDEGFFMYCEDMDLCRRLREAGYGLWYIPEAEVEHIGGASAPRTDLLPVLARSRIRYAAKHRGRWGTLSERAGVALGAATHLVLGRGGVAARRGHARAIGAALSSIPADARPTQSAA